MAHKTLTIRTLQTLRHIVTPQQIRQYSSISSSLNIYQGQDNQFKADGANIKNSSNDQAIEIIDKKQQVKELLIKRTEALKDLEVNYKKMSQMIEFQQETQLEYQPKYIQLGSNYFVHKNQQEKGLKLVHQLDLYNINQFVEGVKNDDYEFYDKYPNTREVLIMGSANVGKSSLINSLNLGQKIAHTAKKQGKTQQLNFYLAQHEVNKRKKGMLVDSPGYGYVFAPVALKKKWRNMMFKYIGFGVRLNLILLCVNAHIGLKQNDIQMLEDLQHFKKPVQVVLTKIDKVREGELIRVTSETSMMLQKYHKFVNPEVHLVCSDHFFGMKELRARIATAFEENDRRII